MFVDINRALVLDAYCMRRNNNNNNNDVSNNG